MKKVVVILLALVLAGCAAEKIIEQPKEVEKMIIEGIDLEWLGHASFKIKTDKIIYIDPYEIPEEEKADIILITHEHYDHCSITDIKNLAKKGTHILVTPDCLSKVSGIEGADIIPVEPDKGYDVDGVKVETLPAYNMKKQFHPKENEWVGYILNLKDKRVYHAGDTDFIPEMKGLKNIDIALLPIGGTYTMNTKEAAEAANTIRPRIAIPMHYNKIQGTEADPEDFKNKVNKGIEVKIP